MDQPIPTISLVAPSPKTNWLLFLVGGIVILGLGIGIGLFLAKNIYPPLQILPTPLPAEALAKEGDPTANWKIYTASASPINSVWYEIKYPQENFDISFHPSEGMGEDYTKITSKNIKRDIHSEVESGLDSIIVFVGPDINDYPLTTLQVGDYEAKKWTDSQKGFTFIRYYILIPNSNNYLQVSIQTKGADSEVYLGYIDQILSTFKFVEQTSSVDMSNWKTYTNNKCKYQISYPESWMLFPEPEKAIYGVALLVSYGNDKKPSDNNWLKVQIGCGVVSAGDSQRQTVDMLNARDSGYGVPKVESLGQTTVNGKSAYKQITTAPVGDPVLEYYIFADDTLFVNIGFTPSTSKLSAEMQQMISSFKFIK